jgi:hypothetical protein
MKAINGPLTFLAAAAMVRYLRVKLDAAGKLTPAAATEQELGTLNDRVTVIALPASIEPAAPGIAVWMVASKAVDRYAKVYGAAGGKVSDVANENYKGIALDVATADGDEVRVLRLAESIDIDPLGSIDGNIVIDEDFLGDWPAAGTALPGCGWTKTETNGLGVTSVDAPNGIAKFAFDAVAEAATSALYYANSPIDIDKTPIVEFLATVHDKGDDAALDIDFGLASDTHATDFEAIAAFAAFHLDGNDLSLKAHSDDGTTDVAAVDSGVDLVAQTYYAFRIDLTNKADVKFSYRAVGVTDWTRINSGTTYNMSAYAGALTPIVLVEKTENDTTADFRVDRVRVQAKRN